VLSTARVERGELVVGEWTRALDRSGVQPTVRELFGATDDRFTAQPGHYTQAAQLVHYLSRTNTDEHPRWTAFLARIGAGARWDVAWRDELGTVDLDRLDAALGRDRVRLGLHRSLRRVPFHPPPDGAPSTTQLADGDVHLLWTELRSWSTPGALARVRADLAQAHKTNGSPVEVGLQSARAALLAGDRAQAARIIREALTRSPHDAALLAVAMRLRIADEWTVERLRAHASTPFELHVLAEDARDRGRSEEALTLASRITTLRPSSASAWRFRAEVARAAGNVHDARVATARWAALAPDDGDAVAMLVELGRTPDPAPPRTRGGIALEGRLVDERGAPLSGWVHVATADDWAQARVDADGRFRVVVAPGRARLTGIADDTELLWDRRIETVRAGAPKKDLGDVPLVRGHLPSAPLAYDGLACGAVDGTALITAIQEGSPAAAVDLRVGDRIVAINGRDVSRWGGRAIDLALAGEIGDRVRVTVERRGATTASFDEELMLAPTRAGDGTAAIVIDNNRLSVNGVSLAGFVGATTDELGAFGLRFDPRDDDGWAQSCSDRARLWGTPVRRACISAREGVVVGLSFSVDYERDAWVRDELTKRLGAPRDGRWSMWAFSDPSVVIRSLAPGRFDVSIAHRSAPVGCRVSCSPMLNLLVLGDSILWGQGLREEDKLTRRFADAWSEARNADVSVARYAHSGATIWREPRPPGGAPPELVRTPPVFERTLDVTNDELEATPACRDVAFRDREGEIPQSEPYLLRQIADARREIGPDVDLVLVDFGMNDTNIYNLVLPAKERDAVVARGRSLAPRMELALRRLREAFPSAPVIVTGYYRVVSGASNPRRLRSLSLEIAVAAGQNVLDAIRDILFGEAAEQLARFEALQHIDFVDPVADYFRDVARRNEEWVAAIHETISGAIARVDPHRIRLAIPDFGPEHAIFTTDSLLWPGLDGDDPMRRTRNRIADARSSEFSFYQRTIVRLASTGHPTEAGARRYADAIRRAATELGLFS
jgi:hypothetical protein